MQLIDLAKQRIEIGTRQHVRTSALTYIPD